MRPIAFWLLSAALAAGAFVPSVSHAQEASVTLASRYIDTFNTAIGNEPSLQVEASYSFNKHVYVSAYAYTGFTKPFADKSSEYGFEAGGQWELGKATVTLAAGRYADYEGQGFGAGDWYVKAGVTYKRVSASVSALKGENKTVLLNVSYELPITKRLTVTPSLVYLTAERKLNPALTASYDLTEHLSIGAKFVLPKNEDTGSRNLYAAAMLTFKF